MISIKVLGSSSKGNGYIVTDGVTNILLEAGVSINQIKEAVDFDMSQIHACLVSHEHGDHAKSIKDVTKYGISVYASAGTFNELDLKNHRLKSVKHKDVFVVGTWTVLAFNLQHDAAEPLGFLLANKTGGKLLFITDTYYCKYTFKNLTHIMIECNHSAKIVQENLKEHKLHPSQSKRLARSHFSLENVKDFLRANDLTKVQEIHLLHLSDANANSDEFQQEIAALTGKPVYIAEKPIENEDI